MRSRFLFLSLGVGLALTVFVARAADSAPSAPEWSALTEKLAQQPGTVARFEERRFFPYRKEPLILRGQVRVSHRHGLSLQYLHPEPRTVIIDDQGMLLRGAEGHDAPPPDPRANAANAALRQILRLDFAALEKDFEVQKTMTGERWSVELAPRTPSVRRTIGSIAVSGRGTEVLWIELSRSAKQRIEIALSDVRASEFSADDVKRYFR
jgi:hypothetical protein